MGVSLIFTDLESSSDDDSEFDFTCFYQPDLAHGEGSSKTNYCANNDYSTLKNEWLPGTKKKCISFSNKVEVFQGHVSKVSCSPQINLSK